AWTEREEPDVLALQEIKTEDAGFPREAFAELGYHIETYGQRTYNGVALLAKKPLEAVIRGFPEEPEDAPRRLLAASVAGLRVICVYVPNGQVVGSDKFAYKLEWMDALAAYLESSASPTEPLLVLGDFNVAPEERDVHFPDRWRGQVLFHPEERARLAKLEAWGLFDLFRKHHQEGGFYSWWDYRQLAFPKNDGLRIDLILGTRPILDRSFACNIDRNERKGKAPSDHAPVVVFLS
ncbi:MAG TPA: exodeoxyribonuclease III, partial [Thermoanaerobaculia bacterium]|nr:exodeoxyribonuclease III [Thermoanaerobaculia bacterium]